MASGTIAINLASVIFVIASNFSRLKSWVITGPNRSKLGMYSDKNWRDFFFPLTSMAAVTEIEDVGQTAVFCIYLKNPFSQYQRGLSIHYDDTYLWSNFHEKSFVLILCFYPWKTWTLLPPTPQKKMNAAYQTRWAIQAL